MNTLKKGNAFEDKVFSYILTELSDDRLHVPGKRSKAYQKKSYFSKDRQSEIITDISIETFLPNAHDYSLLTVIECKDYSNAIPVSLMEEFHSKVQQITGDNVKAIFITTAALQKSALNYAISKKIGVIRYLPDNQVRHLIFYTTSINNSEDKMNPSEFISAFLIQDYKNADREFYACDNEYIYPSLFSVLEKYLN